ncbi:ABC transporter ATP-binding protein [Altibacter sp. HG106]|uniref:ABC transporter ATP-binding protein n=1 Tax=Altibacter sp. HG106 TaxID=3023937 RepID=UPI0023503FBF|nr:ABC transporter ATP-binding protein [Altibacter sp. HG106]MDC7995723.1 ABC transporter ATP-binding protein [Altibacter sp. HG106]
MSNIILKAEHISKQYRLGLVGTGTLVHDMNRFWHRIRGKEDPYLKVGAVNDRSAAASEDYVWALRDINFEVKEGEVLGIIGKNGAGKSTLLKLLSRVTSPTTGTIKSRGRIASLLEVGTGFHPELTGRENIYLNGAILGMTKAEITAKIDEIIAFSGCEMYIDTPTKRYSSGMTVRLGFAVAAHLEPDILVVDEVLAVGDAEFQKKAIGKMQAISSGEGRTVLFVSHNMASVSSLCSRTIVLKNGQLDFEGDTEDGISHYLKNHEGHIRSNVQRWSKANQPNDKGVFLTSGRIYGKGKSEDEPIRMDDEIILEYQLEVDDLQRDIFVNTQFLDDNGSILFATTSQFNETRSQSNENGKCVLRMTIQKNFFNQGEFSTNLVVKEHVDGKNVTLFSKTALLSFIVTPRPIELGRWMGKSKGPLRPDFDWTKEFISNE